MKISICCPSYKRSGAVETLEYIPFLKVFVSPEEYPEYKKFNKDKNIVECPKGVQGNVSRVRNYILDSEFAKGVDAVAIVDDDLRGICYWEKTKVGRLKTEHLLVWLEKYTNVAKGFGARFWGLLPGNDKQSYREYTPFSTTSFVGGPFQCVLKENELRYDEALPLKEDYDFTIQNLNKYRVVFRLNKFFNDCRQAEQPGGCATIRNYDKEAEQLVLLTKKWGSQIVKADRADRSHNLVKQKKQVDFNPIIRVPIKGV